MYNVKNKKNPLYLYDVSAVQGPIWTLCTRHDDVILLVLEWDMGHGTIPPPLPKSIKAHKCTQRQLIFF